MEPKRLRSECRTCLSWDFRKTMCLRIAHGMACVVGELPAPGFYGKSTPPPEWANIKAWSPLGGGRGGGKAAGAADQAIYKKIADNYDAKPTNRFLSWSHENLAKFAKDTFEENLRLREKLIQIQSVLGA